MNDRGHMHGADCPTILFNVQIEQLKRRRVQYKAQTESNPARDILRFSHAAYIFQCEAWRPYEHIGPFEPHHGSPYLVRTSHQLLVRLGTQTGTRISLFAAMLSQGIRRPLYSDKFVRADQPSREV